MPISPISDHRTPVTVHSPSRPRHVLGGEKRAGNGFNVVAGMTLVMLVVLGQLEGRMGAALRPYGMGCGGGLGEVE